MDFTLQQYTRLLKSLKKTGYSFQPFGQFVENPLPKVAILRHDVDRLPVNSLRMAQIESESGICGSYYFRIVKESNNPEIIRQIAGLGHEIGYHYEDMALAKGDIEKAINSFIGNLNYFRQFYPVSTICKHGSPLSKFDNREMWKKYDYRSYGIIGEPYFDVDYTRVFYITDTGRKWNNRSSNVRDIVDRPVDIPIQSTGHLISLIEQEKLPDSIMINTHPQRWFDGGFGWYKEFLMQNFKNLIKQIIVRSRHNSK